MNTQEIFKWTAATVGAIVAVIVIAVVSGWIYGVDDAEVAAVQQDTEVAEVADVADEAEAAEAAEPAQEQPAPEPAPAAEPAAAPAPAAGGGDLVARLAGGDAAAGVALLARCRACHTLNEDGPRRVGPNIWGIVGKAKGTSEGYAYSDALANAGGTWTFADLDGYLTAPRVFLPGTKMTFPGIPDAADRANTILSLRALSNDPVPLP
jgi:cytochrome c